MRIFFASPATAHQHSLPNSRLWHSNLYDSLIELGHDVVVFDFDYAPYNAHLDPAVAADRAFIELNRPRFGEELLRQFGRARAEAPVDLFFSYFYSAYVEASVIRDIGASGVPTVNWYCNASYQFHLVEEIAPAYDYSLVPERSRLDDYRRVGANPIYCQEAANPSVYRPYDVVSEFDITFVGQRYGDRPAFLQALLDADLDARAWGPHWQYPPRHAPAWRLAAGRLKRHVLGRPEPPRATVPQNAAAAAVRSRLRADVQQVQDQPRLHEGCGGPSRRDVDSASAASRLRGANERRFLPRRTLRGAR